jgi:hypothetical protein
VEAGKIRGTNTRVPDGDVHLVMLDLAEEIKQQLQSLDNANSALKAS